MPSPFKVTEAKIEEKVNRYCAKNRIHSRKFSSPARRGVPDRVFVGRGRVLFLELKRPGNTPTALQRREIKLLKEAGANADWADSYEKAVAMIEHYILGKPMAEAALAASDESNPVVKVSRAQINKAKASLMKSSAERTAPRKKSSDAPRTKIVTVEVACHGPRADEGIEEPKRSAADMI